MIFLKRFPRRPIQLLPYQRKWKHQFLRLKKRLVKQISSPYFYVHHVGSTAVEGLAAKPIVDIDIELFHPSQWHSLRLHLMKLGYIHVGNQGIEGREVFKLKRWNLLPQHHLYVCFSGSRELNRHLGFRDYLRHHPEALQAYAILKRDLAKKYRLNREAYSTAKTPFIEQIYKQLSL